MFKQKMDAPYCAAMRQAEQEAMAQGRVLGLIGWWTWHRRLRTVLQPGPP